MMDSHISRAHQRQRGLLFEWQGTSEWGWGHVLAAAYALHAVCVRAERLCHLKLYDMEIGAFFGYATRAPGLPRRWDEMPAFDAGRYPTIANETWAPNFRPWIARDEGEMDRLAARLRDHPAHLLHVTVPRSNLLPMAGQRWLPYGLPLSSNDGNGLGALIPRGVDRDASAAAASEAPRLHVDRCFCRYVTEPSFASMLSPAVRHALTSAPVASVALHLRTGLADVDDASLAAISARHKHRGNTASSKGSRNR